MKLILVLGALLWLLLSWFANSVGLKAEEITTDNLISQDFTDGSWNNPVNSWHAPNDLAGWNGLEHTTEVTYTPETEALKENGFSMTAGGEIFYWYSGQKVHVNQSVTLDNGTVFEQTKTYEASRGTVHDVANTIVISSNTSASYDLGMGILFEDNRGLDGHRSADFRDPYITLTYDDTVFQLDETIQEQITEDLDTIKEVVKNVKITFEETKVEEIYNEEVKTEIKVANKITEEYKEEVFKEVTEKVSDYVKEEIIEEEYIEEKTEEFKEDSDNNDSKEVVKKDSKQEIKTKVSSTKTKTSKPKLDLIMAKVDAQVKDASKNLNIKNIIKLDAMQKDSVSLIEYNNTEFYKPKDIYLDQIAIFDNRSIYKNFDLVQYRNNDIIGIKNRTLEELNINKQRILIELKELKNG